jgi:hypothetical protein
LLAGLSIPLIAVADIGLFVERVNGAHVQMSPLQADNRDRRKMCCSTRNSACLYLQGYVLIWPYEFVDDV